MPRWWVKWMLFLTSYLPLLLIFLVRDFDIEQGYWPFRNPAFSLEVAAHVVVAGGVFVMIILSRREPGRSTETVACRRRKYVAAYRSRS